MTLLRLWIDRHFGEPGATSRWWHVGADGRVLAQGRSEPRHWPLVGPDGAAPACEVLLDAHLVSRVVVDLPPGRAARREDIVRYAVEEQLLDEVGDLHLTVGPRRDDGRHEVIAMARARLEGLLASLQTLGLAPARVAVAAQGLPGDEARILLADDALTLVDRDGWLALDDGDADRTGPAVAWFATRAARPRVTAVAGTTADAGALARAHGLEATPPVDSATLAAGVNLLHGEFAGARGDSLHWRQWLPLARLAAAAAALAWFIVVGEWMWLRQTVRTTAGEQAALVRQALPEVSVVVAPALQMQRGVDEHRHRAGALGESDLLPLLAALADAGGARLESARYGDARLEATLLLADAAAIDTLRTALRARHIGTVVRSSEPAGGGRRVVLQLTAGVLS